MELVSWKIDYKEEILKRCRRLELLQRSPQHVQAAKMVYTSDPKAFIRDWAITLDPRNASTGVPVQMPFILFPRQEEFIDWLYETAFLGKENCLVDKCRDVGLSWLCAAFAVWAFTFHNDVTVGWGANKEDGVYMRGNPKAGFTKMQAILDSIPPCFRPRYRAIKLLFQNLDNGASIVGEIGINQGRGGRTTMYFKDEAAHYEHAEEIEASLGENTDAQVDVSTHLGTNTIFFRKSRNYPANRVFEFNWDQNPLHTPEWFKKKEQFYLEELGLPYLFEQEIMRNPGGSVPNVLIPQKYVRAAIDAHKVLGISVCGEKRIALDVADEGGDKNSTVERHGIAIRDLDLWGEGTTTETADRAIAVCDDKEIYNLAYDSIGVGAGVKGECKRQNAERAYSGRPPIKATGWNAGGGVVDPYEEFVEGKTNGDMFKNANSQAWWELRERFRKTWECIEQDKIHDFDDLISIDSDMGTHKVEILKMELSQPRIIDPNTTNGKILIEKKPKGTKSPNAADAVKIAFARLDDVGITETTVSGLS